MKELLEIIRARRSRPDLPFALATVVCVVGSSYRKPGARMLVSLSGRVAGSVSGGCLERDVITRARAVLLGGPPELAVYDTTDQDDMAFGTSLGCQGRIEILIQLLAPGAEWPLAEEAGRVVESRQACVLATVYRAADAAWIGCTVPAEQVFPPWRPAVLAAAGSVSATHKAATVEIESAGLLVERLAPPTRLVIFGAGHDVPPLVRLARELGHHVTVVDRRADFAEAERFPAADAVLHLRPHELDGSGLLAEDAAAVIMNHHYETDAELLARLVGRPLAYLGMLGPRKRTLKILREAAEQGFRFGPEDLARLHAPVGLDLGSETPEQIALCILAELQGVLAGRPSPPRARPSIADEFFAEPVLAVAR